MSEGYTQYQKTIDILQALAAKYPLEPEEKEAITTAVGLLSWARLGESRLKSLGAKRKHNL